jgi:transcription elongation factor SPT5
MADSDDNVDSSDEESEEEEQQQQQQRKPQKKRKRPDTSQFFDDMADVDDDDEDEEDDGPNNYGEEEISVEMEQEMEAQNRRRAAAQFRIGDDEDIEEQAKMIEERHAQEASRRQAVRGMVSGGGFHQAPVSQQAQLPSVDDPKLFMVKCKVGSEKEIVTSLMRKFLAFEKKPNPIGISSVTWPGTKGFIYVEAHKESAAQAIIKNMRMCMPWSIKLVPINEMTSVLTVASKKKALKEGAWVRIKRGVYKDDLGKVDTLLDSGSKAVVRLMPRIDLNAIVRRATGVKKTGKPPKPPQKFFKLEEIQRALRESNLGMLDLDRRRYPHTGDMFDYFNKEFYNNGYLYKEFKVETMLKYTEVNPTLDELQRFRDSGQKGDDDDDDEDFAASLQLEKRQDQGVSLCKGDTVRVIEGDLQHLMGVVTSVSATSQNVKIRPLHNDIKDQELEFPITQLMKYVKVGDHVKVINGRYTGETGVVVNVEEMEGQWEAVVLTDASSKEIQCFVKDLRETTEVAQNLGSLGGFDLHDLVMLGQTNVGVIVRVGREDFQVLNQHGVVQTLSLQELRGKRNRNSDKAVALDSRTNHIQVGDMVNVDKGAHSGHSGIIKRMHRAFLFLHSNKKLENAGIFVTKARDVVLAGANLNRALGGNFGQNGKGMAARGKGGKGFQDQDELVGKSVKVRRGIFKGYMGVVKSTTELVCKVELHAKSKILSIDRKYVEVVGNRHGEHHVAGQGGMQQYHEPMAGATPVLGMGTPMWGASPGHSGFGHQTPLMGQGTPLHTPMHEAGSTTPLHTPAGNDDAWNPSVSFTPQRVEHGDESGSDFGGGMGVSPAPDSFSVGTPMSSFDTPSGTPGYQPSTPNSLMGGHEASGMGMGMGGGMGMGTSSYATPANDMSTPITPISGAPTPYGGGQTPAYQMGGQTPAMGGNTPLPGTPVSGMGSSSDFGSSTGTPYPPSENGSYATGGGSVAGGSGGDMWFCPKMVVEYAINPTASGKQGVVVSVDEGGRTCQVRLDTGETISANFADLRNVAPDKKDKVIVASGEQRGQTGDLIGIDEQDGALVVSPIFLGVCFASLTQFSSPLQALSRWTRTPISRSLI